MYQAAVELCELVISLQTRSQEKAEALVLGGGTFSSPGFRSLLGTALEDNGIRFEATEHLEYGVDAACQLLARSSSSS
jgi:hypothetical protein